jgi:hypothetical protein
MSWNLKTHSSQSGKLHGALKTRPDALSILFTSLWWGVVGFSCCSLWIYNRALYATLSRINVMQSLLCMKIKFMNGCICLHLYKEKLSSHLPINFSF